jgi:rhomboid family GlyGly-CTERM serine protease
MVQYYIFHSLTRKPERRASLALSMLALVLLAATAQLGNDQALAWQRSALDAGEWWRLGSGIWVHLSWAHAALNLAGAACVVAMFERWIAPWQQLLALTVMGFMTGLLLWWGFPQVQWMVGLSGPLHGLFAWNAWTLTRRQDPRPEGAWWRGPRFGYVLLAGVFAKVVLEAVDTASRHGDGITSTWIGGPVLIEAHQAGLLAGLMLCTVTRVITRVRRGC